MDAVAAVPGMAVVHCGVVHLTMRCTAMVLSVVHNATVTVVSDMLLRRLLGRWFFGFFLYNLLFRRTVGIMVSMSSVSVTGRNRRPGMMVVPAVGMVAGIGMVSLLRFHDMKRANRGDYPLYIINGWVLIYGNGSLWRLHGDFRIYNSCLCQQSLFNLLGLFCRLEAVQYILMLVSHIGLKLWGSVLAK
ncbi:hypothetical protein GCM10023187_14110 [Nibrella viscosa]|uniref:Uncharacterized protein n=1 Tax=Nibrella viscosa TaxID=1084524 RepID=A0ABP8K5F3_9BACT